MNASLDELRRHSPASPRRETLASPYSVSNLLQPIRAFRWRYLPLLMVYFAYGALGLIDVTRDMWVKESLTLKPAQLAGIGVWLSLPWTVKMVFGELVDSVPIFGSQRRSYILIGAAFTASGLLTLAGAAGGWLAFTAPGRLYVLGALLIVIGTVMQDVVADAMSTEVVSRVDETGSARPDARHSRRARHGAGARPARRCRSASWRSPDCPAGWPAFCARETVFLLGLIVPADLGDRRAADPLGDGRAPADRLAHSRRRPRLRRHRARARAGRRAVRAGTDLRAVDGGDLHACW